MIEQPDDEKPGWCNDCRRLGCGCEYKPWPKSYAKITPAHPSYGIVQTWLARGAFACDSVDHNEQPGCSNPACFKFSKGGVTMQPGPVTPAATGKGLCEQI